MSSADLTAQRTVVVTGAGGGIGSLIVERLSSRWRIRANDLRARPGIEPLDVTDLDGCLTAFAGADAVVHMAGNPAPDADWESLRGPNVEGTWAVAEAARRTGVRRLVLASSLQALTAEPVDRQRRAEDPPRPANLYGATKAWAEAVGSWVAASSQTSVVAIRIGHFGMTAPTGAGATPRNLSAWLSPDDCVRLVQAAVESTRRGFVVVNGTSANRFRHAEFGEAEASIGYQPVDDAWTPVRGGRRRRSLRPGPPAENPE